MTHKDDVPSFKEVVWLWVDFFVELLRVIIGAFLRLLLGFTVFTLVGHAFVAVFIGMSSRFIFFREGIEMPYWWTPVHEILVDVGYVAMPVLFPALVILAVLFIVAVEWLSTGIWAIITWPF